MKTSMTLVLAGAAVLSAAAPAFAQTPFRETRDPVADAQYQRDLDTYNAQQRRYDNQRDAYDSRVDNYSAERAAYERRRAQYVRDRDAYDRRYGVGAYDRRYPSYARDYASSRYDDRNAGRYGADASAQVAACDSRNNTAIGGVLGALAGAAVGSNVAARNARTEGAVLGAVVGGAIGANVGKATARCDQTGYYYSYDQTSPYREAMEDRRDGSGRRDYGYYTSQRCRLAPAPTELGGRMDYRYVRVCPDPQGRYRITG
jgi:hypothetical protein